MHTYTFTCRHRLALRKRVWLTHPQKTKRGSPTNMAVVGTGHDPCHLENIQVQILIVRVDAEDTRKNLRKRDIAQ